MRTLLALLVAIAGGLIAPLARAGLPFVQGTIHSQHVYSAERIYSLACSDRLEWLEESRQYREFLGRLGGRIRVDFPDNSVKRVLYPMSGYDAAAPAILFPDADIISVDRHAFHAVAFATPNRNTLGIERGITSVWEAEKAVDRARYIGPRILGSLADSGFRVHSVTVFTLENDFLEGERTVHALIKFDRGPGTPTRRFFQIQSEIPRQREKYWWLRSLSGNWKPDAVLVKGSMHYLSEISPKSLRQLMLHWLADTSGLLVSGGVSMPLEVFDDDRRWLGELIPSPDEAKTGRMRIYSSAEGFSYSDAAFVFEILGR